MKKIEELINCLGTVLVRYHEKQCGAVAGEVNARVTQLLSAKDYDVQFKALNAEATKKYNRCQSLLQHLLDCIVYLKHINAQQSFSPDEFKSHKNNIALLLSGINQLLQIKQQESHETVTPQKKAATNDFIFGKISLSGCRIPGRIAGYSMCFSGQLIIDDLFNQIIPPAKMNPKGFELFAEDVLKEQIPIWLTATAQTTKLAQAEKDIDGQKDRIAALTAEIEKARRLEEILKAKLDKTEATLNAKFDEAIAKGKKTQAELSEQLKQLQKDSAIGGYAAVQYCTHTITGNPQVFFGMNYEEARKRSNQTQTSSVAPTNSS